MLFKDTIKIAHISDLHFSHCRIRKKKEEKLLDNFKHVITKVSEEAPDLIVITGDLVNTPFSSNFSLIKESIQQLYESCKTNKEGRELHIISVPGNHDLYFWGNNLFNIIPRSNFKKFEEHVNYPENCKTNKKAAESFFKQSGVAVFPLDSNHNFAYWGWAQGRVSNVETTLKELNATYRDHADKNGWDYHKCHKVAILHHHPLPVSTFKFDRPKESEQFLALKGAYSLLYSLKEFGINVLLHGHKHISSITRFVLHDEGKIIISSCASSSFIKEEKREIKFIDLTARGVSSVRSYTADGDRNIFKHEPTLSKELIDYGEARKNRYLLKNDKTSPVKSLKEKKKIIRIRTDGSAAVDLSMNGITWEDWAREKDRSIKERFRADSGRIIGAYYEFSGCPLYNRTDQKEWEHPGLDPSDCYPNPDKPDKFEYTFDLPIKGYVTNESCCKIAYIGVNCFALTQEEHVEMYPRWDNRRVREEDSSISVNYPTEFLQMILVLPSKDHFPQHPDDIAIHVSSIIPFDKEADQYYYLYAEYDHQREREEERFLKEKGAIKLHPETNVIEVIIKYPQPDMVYTLRWALPQEKNLSQLSERDEKIAITLQKEILNSDSTNTEKFYKELQETFCNFEWYDKSVKLFLLGYENDTNLLKIVKHPLDFPPIANICIGRGAVGKAFKTRKYQCWKRPSKKDNLDQKMEKSIKDLDPYTVVAIPLLYPRIISERWNSIKNEGKYRFPVFGILSIVSDRDQSNLEKYFNIVERKIFVKEDFVTSTFRIDERNTKMTTVYKLLESLVKNNFRNILT